MFKGLMLFEELFRHSFLSNSSRLHVPYACKFQTPYSVQADQLKTEPRSTESLTVFLVINQLNGQILFFIISLLYASCALSCVGCVCGADVARHNPHRTHDLRGGSQDYHQSKNSVQKTICCNSTFNASDDGLMYPKYVELRIH